MVSFAEGPDFVRVARGFLNVAFLFAVAVAVAVNAHHGAENAVLEPADNKLAVFIARCIRTVKAADIRIPPREAADRHIKPRLNLL